MRNRIQSNNPRSTGLVLVAALLLVSCSFAGGLNQGLQGISLDRLFPDAVFDSAIPTQQETTGVEPALRPLRTDEVLSYFRALADASPRASLFEYAQSHEGRPLVYMAISDEQTIEHLEQFKEEHGRLLDPRIEAKRDLKDQKAVAWMAYGIHGDELSSIDAAAALAYWLVAGEDEPAQTVRRRLLILIDPCENPDGRARYLAQTLSFAHLTVNPDQDDLSHTGVWPMGRGNHYLFDLNRDWFTMVHPESARSREIAAWVPQLVVDSHEMGDNATYLFAPPRHPFNPHLPSSSRTWEHPFSDDQAAALDARGYPYFTGEWNEEFFPGYGSSWASYHGAVGILYEMSGTSGTLVRKRGGTVRTFAQAVEHQLASSVANLTTLVDNAPAVLRDQIEARREIVAQGKSAVACWVFPPDSRDPDRLGSFAELLVDQGIEVQVLRGTAAKGSGLRDIRTGGNVAAELQPGSLLVRLDQPSGALARVILDPHVPMESGFLSEEREYIERGKGSRLYETTSWSLPLARGLSAYWGPSVPTGDWQAWTGGEEGTGTSVSGPWTSIVVDGGPDRSAPFLTGLLQEGVTVRIGEKPFAIGGRSFDRGAIVIRKEGNRENVDEVVNRLGARYGIDLHAVATSRSDDGPYLGGSHFLSLVSPRVGVLTGMPVATTAYGSIWHLLDHEIGLRFSGLDIGRFRVTDLARYNVLVFPPVWGGPSTYRDLLGPGGVDRLRSWVEAGGTAIGIGGGARLLADEETGLTRARFRAQTVEASPPPVWSIDAIDAEAAGQLTAAGVRVQPSKAGKDSGEGGAPDVSRDSPYDVAPILGPGARPFAQGVDVGTPLGGAPMEMHEWLKEVLPPGKKTPEEQDLKKADRRLQSFMPRGAMLRVDLDEELWLNFGLGDSMTVWFRSNDSLIAGPPVAVAARFSSIGHLHRGGLLWPEGAARLAHTAYATRESVGRGQVILFAEDPTFRRWMKESERLFINAILYGPGLGTRWSRPW